MKSNYVLTHNSDIPWHMARWEERQNSSHSGGVSAYHYIDEGYANWSDITFNNRITSTFSFANDKGHSVEFKLYFFTLPWSH